MHEPEQIIDLQRYPVLPLDTVQLRTSLAQWQQQYIEEGTCVLEHFVREDAVVEMVQEANDLAPLGFHNTLTGNAYLEDVDDTLPADHPKRITETTSLAAVAGDQFPASSTIRSLYEWDALIELVRLITRLDRLYLYDCPLGRLNLSVMKNDDYLRWHFDQSDFVVSMPLQEAEEGGLFEFVHNLRSDNDENFEEVAKVLTGDESQVQVLQAPIGSLILFRGKNTLHRVTRIGGNQARLHALFSYAEQPDVRGSDYLKEIRYGRAH